MWELIQANRRKSLILFISLGLTLLLIGYFFGSAYYPDGGGFIGIFFAFIIWGILSLISYFSGSKILLAVSGAKEVTKEIHPQLFNVVEEMKRCDAVIGGEGNGGIIYPGLHYGRDALVGIALFLSYLAKRRIKCSELRSSYPGYAIAKKKVTLDQDADIVKILESVRKHFSNCKIDERDGMKIDFETGWLHIRKSNTEPIIRIYAENTSIEKAERLADEVIKIVKKL